MRSIRHRLLAACAECSAFWLVLAIVARLLKGMDAEMAHVGLAANIVLITPLFVKLRQQGTWARAVLAATALTFAGVTMGFCIDRAGDLGNAAFFVAGAAGGLYGVVYGIFLPEGRASQGSLE